MREFGFLVGHGYEILKGFVSANSKEEAIKKIEAKAWDDVIDKCDCDELTEGYEVVEIWEIEKIQTK